MTDRMAEVQRLTDTMLLRVFFHDTFLYGYGLGHHPVQKSIIDLRVEVEQQDGSVNIHRTDKRMLNHFGIAGKQVVAVDRTQELTIDKDTFGRIERTDLVLQTVEVNPGLSPHGRIDRGHQGSRDIDGPQSAFESRTGEASHIGNHPPPQIDQKRISGSPLVRKTRPDVSDLFDVFMCIARLHGNDRGILQGWDIFYQRITLFLCVRIGQDKESIITHGSKERLQIGFEILADYYFLSSHNVLFYYNRCDKGIICYSIIKTRKRKFHAYGTKVS